VKPLQNEAKNGWPVILFSMGQVTLRARILPHRPRVLIKPPRRVSRRLSLYINSERRDKRRGPEIERGKKESFELEILKFV
jgi:hypothetical protein